MATITLRGKVLSGVGEGSLYTELDWAREQFQERIGFRPYPGTLNIRIVGEDNIRLLRSFKGIKIEPPNGFFGGTCFKALVDKKVSGAVVIPDSSKHPIDVLEIIAPVSLRKELNLADGDEIDVQIWLE